ncbi:MAG: DUF2652 domain-containing protein, partial [Gammaproteobacteria bacterium]
MQQKNLIIILADISGYTKFMLDNRTSAVHGQLLINGLIESILAQVDIPLTLQEIEGDAVFLYAADPGPLGDWRRVIEEVSHKLDKFFAAFITQSGLSFETTPCECAICHNAEKLGLKIVVHAGEAVFHTVAGRAQVSGSDVILAHRLLKNTLASHEYLLLTEQAFALMGEYLPGEFEHHRETYEGFGTVPVRVRFLEQEFLQARDSVYLLNDSDLQTAVNGWVEWGVKHIFNAAIQQFHRPIRAFSWLQRTLMLVEAALAIPVFRLYYR